MATLKKRKQYIKGSTLIEVVVALVIIMVVFGIATLTYVHLVNSNNTPALKIQQELAALAAATAAQPSPANQVYSLENDISVAQRVQTYAGGEGLLLLELEAFDRNEKSLGIYRSIIPIEAYEEN